MNRFRKFCDCWEGVGQCDSGSSVKLVTPVHFLLEKLDSVLICAVFPVWGSVADLLPSRLLALTSKSLYSYFEYELEAWYFMQKKLFFKNKFFYNLFSETIMCYLLRFFFSISGETSTERKTFVIQIAREKCLPKILFGSSACVASISSMSWLWI